MTRQQRHRRSGQTMVEFALIGPLFFLMLFGVMEMGRLVWTNHELANGTREAARFAMVHGSEASSCATDQDLIDRILDTTAGLKADQLAPPAHSAFCGAPGSTFWIQTSYDFDPLFGMIPGLDSLTLTAESEVIVQH